MKLIAMILAALFTTAAFGQDGVTAVIDPTSNYRYIGGTRQEGVLDAGLGFVRNALNYGMHLSIGPVLYKDDHSKLTVTYGLGAQVRTSSAAMYHEAAENVQVGVFGLSIGHAWEHGATLGSSEVSGLGNRNFARLSITIGRP